ncbi:hypothetical protein APHMUC_1085 [Anaplasma phagocytophilum str. ApMUC09]|uniref:Uncharacterized protein n=1 Tax=Anaplasma phagocytophilum str. ApMUC09 TaxID=1359152 RepID=A0A0F3NAH2_ANAPH|nr:hypothetical protein APHMUC_1085 [Anaplasma phagocytophilum str. ApMUC09]SCV64325.1 hypothetical protein ANAPH2_00921 [Anaplasma phagocytophilum]
MSVMSRMAMVRKKVSGNKFLSTSGKLIPLCTFYGVLKEFLYIVPLILRITYIRGYIIALFMDRLFDRRDNCFLRYWES